MQLASWLNWPHTFSHLPRCTSFEALWRVPRVLDKRVCRTRSLARKFGQSWCRKCWQATKPFRCFFGFRERFGVSIWSTLLMIHLGKVPNGSSHLRPLLYFMTFHESHRENLHLQIRWFHVVSPHVYIYIQYIYIHTYISHVYITILWRHHLTQLQFTHTSKSVWKIIFQGFCSIRPEEIVIVSMASSPNFSYTLYEHDYYKFLLSMHNLGFRLLGFHHWVPWRGAKTVSKECWGPCYGLIPSLWDFAQTYSPQIERQNQNLRGTFYSLDSEKAIKPCISLSWSTFDWALVVQVCAEICSVCQLGRPLSATRPLNCRVGLVK